MIKEAIRTELKTTNIIADRYRHAVKEIK